MLCALRRIGLHGSDFAKATCGTIRLKLLKIGAIGTRAWRKSREKRYHVAAPELLPDHDRLVGVVPWTYVLGDIQPYRGKFASGRFPHVIRHNDRSMAPRCRER